MDLYPMAVCYNARHDNTIQYNTTQLHTSHITYNIKGKITIKNQEHVLNTIKTQKRVEPKVDDSVFKKTTRYTKQSVNHTIQYPNSHISPRPTPHSTSLPLYTLHIPPRLNSFPSPHLADLHPNSIPFTSFHFDPLITFQPFKTAEDKETERQSAQIFLHKSRETQNSVTNSSHSNNCIRIAP
jgi:hypothetical protein